MKELISTEANSFPFFRDKKKRDYVLVSIKRKNL